MQMMDILPILRSSLQNSMKDRNIMQAFTIQIKNNASFQVLLYYTNHYTDIFQSWTIFFSYISTVEQNELRFLFGKRLIHIGGLKQFRFR